MHLTMNWSKSAPLHLCTSAALWWQGRMHIQHWKCQPEFPALGIVWGFSPLLPNSHTLSEWSKAFATGSPVSFALPPSTFEDIIHLSPGALSTFNSTNCLIICSAAIVEFEQFCSPSFPEGRSIPIFGMMHLIPPPLFTTSPLLPLRRWLFGIK